MSKEKNLSMNGFWRDMFQVGLYKRSQGRITRQVTFAALALVVLLSAWRIWQAFGLAWYGAPALLCIVGIWLSFRAVNMPSFADFLIAVEAEMSKVSWPTRKELLRGSIVVIVTIIVLASLLVVFDLIWQTLLRLLGIGVAG